METKDIFIGLGLVGVLYFATQKSGLIRSSCQRTYPIDGQVYCNNELNQLGLKEVKWGTNYYALTAPLFQQFTQLVQAQQQYENGQANGTVNSLTTFSQFITAYEPQLTQLLTTLGGSGGTSTGAGSGGGTGGGGAYTQDSGCPPGTNWNSITQTCI